MQIILLVAAFGNICGDGLSDNLAIKKIMMISILLLLIATLILWLYLLNINKLFLYFKFWQFFCQIIY